MRRPEMVLLVLVLLVFKIIWCQVGRSTKVRLADSFTMPALPNSLLSQNAGKMLFPNRSMKSDLITNSFPLTSESVQ
jgi:hypothetical protein